MGVSSDAGSYGIPAGLIYSYPVYIKDKQWTIVQGLDINDFSREKMDISAKELVEERDVASSFLKKDWLIAGDGNVSKLWKIGNCPKKYFDFMFDWPILVSFLLT